jgi:hypothetical protein
MEKWALILYLRKNWTTSYAKKIATNIIFKKKTEQLLAVGLQIEFDIFYYTPQRRWWNVPLGEPKGHFFYLKTLLA